MAQWSVDCLPHDIFAYDHHVHTCFIHESSRSTGSLWDTCVALNQMGGLDKQIYFSSELISLYTETWIYQQCLKLLPNTFNSH